MPSINSKLSINVSKICVVFGTPLDLDRKVLPTVENVIRFYDFVENSLPQGPMRSQNALRKVAEVVFVIWNNILIPTYTVNSILRKLKCIRDELRNLKKSYKSRLNVPSFKLKLREFQEDAKKLFDISICKCGIICSCLKPFKVPKNQKTFLLDQRSMREMIIENPSEDDSLRIDIIQAQSKTISPGFAKPPPPERRILIRQPLTNSNTCTKEVKAHNFYSRRSLPNLARVLDRYNTSDREGAAIASATLQDFELISTEDMTNVIDRNKIRRNRSQSRVKLLQEYRPKSIKGLYFDGRKDTTLVMDDGRRRKKKEEHITLINEPGSLYLGHTSPVSGTSVNVTASIFEFIDKDKLSTAELKVVGCDGTNVNVGNLGGIIHLIEVKLDRPVQWFICQLHANELHLRHLIEHLDGATNGPEGFNGPIGKQLKGCHELPTERFRRMKTNLPDVTSEDLSTDQKYLLEICRAISEGKISDALAKKHPGKIVHSRWLTTANCILRVYVSKKKPEANLVILVKFILQVYAPMWFTIKMNKSCVYGAINLWKTVKLSRYLPKKLKDVVDVVIRRNGFFGHVENMLLAMLYDDRKIIRQRAVNYILEARNLKDQIQESGIRKFVLPDFNFNAKNYVDLINWKKVPLTEPPLTMDLSESELNNIVINPKGPALQKIKAFPLHTQAVERAVKMVTEASSSVCGAKNRDGLILGKVESRRIMPKFDTKKHYRCQ